MRTFRLSSPLTAVKRLSEWQYEMATLPPNAVLIYQGELGMAAMVEVDCNGEIYGVFLSDLEKKSVETLTSAAAP